MADTARHLPPGHSLEQASARIRGARYGFRRHAGEKSALSKMISDELGRFDRHALTELLPAHVVMRLPLDPPDPHGAPRIERMRCSLIAYSIEWALENHANLDREALKAHAAKERELAGLFRQLVDIQRKEGRY